jgi:hypothetical protein
VHWWFWTTPQAHGTAEQAWFWQALSWPHSESAQHAYSTHWWFWTEPQEQGMVMQAWLWQDCS